MFGGTSAKIPKIMKILQVLSRKRLAFVFVRGNIHTTLNASTKQKYETLQKQE